MERIPLAIDRKGWRMWATVTTGCFAVTMAAIAVGASIAYGIAEGLAVAGIFAVVLAPMLWVAWFASRNSRSEAWLEAGRRRLILHHPVYLVADLDLGAVTRAFYVGDASGEARPSYVAPDVYWVMQAKRWNLVLVFTESFFLARAPRRAVGAFNYFSRGFACRVAPHRNYWIRGLFAVVEDPQAAAAALETSGIERLPELTSEVRGWLAADRPAPLRRAWRNLRRDRGRPGPGPIR